MTRTAVVHLCFSSAPAPLRGPEAALEEAKGLAAAISLDVVHSEIITLNRPKPATLIGKGKLESIKMLAVDLLIVNGSLTPGQQRNLEKELNAKVIDRTALILEIFGARAKTAEGRLQVELASLTYQRSRLVRSWTHLERQKGGFGFLGGPGESQLELDRRMLDDRIIRLKKDLEKVKRTRHLQRKARHHIPTVALVGYTNAGKSTLFNALCGSDVFAKDLLFATLDPTMRQKILPSGQKVVFSDTVGFISDLPTSLIAAFQATLEEVLEADLLLHVQDISSPEGDAQKKDVLNVLEEIGIQDHPPIIDVLNKIDLIPEEQRPVNGLSISAFTGEGLKALIDCIDNFFRKQKKLVVLKIPLTDGKAIAQAYEAGEVIKREDSEDTATVHLLVNPF